MKRAARNYGAGGAVLPKNSCINFVDGVPEIYVGERDVHLEDAVPVAARGLENCVYVVERCFGLFLDRARLFIARRWIDTKLTGDEDESVVDSGLRVVSGRLRRVWGVDSFDF